MSVRGVLGSQRFAAALVVVGVVMLVAPALAPVQPVLYHDTREGTTENETQLEQQGFTVVAYGNLSERGQELYVETLRNGGEYTVSQGAGASEFAYPTPGELGEVDDYPERRALTTVVVERPPDAETLPPSDEPVEFAEDIAERREERRQRAREAGEPTPEPDPDRPSVEEFRQQIARYDMMSTRTASPPLTATGPLLRLLSAGLGIVAIGVGGYRRSLP